MLRDRDRGLLDAIANQPPVGHAVPIDELAALGFGALDVALERLGTDGLIEYVSGEDLASAGGHRGASPAEHDAVRITERGRAELGENGTD